MRNAKVLVLLPLLSAVLAAPLAISNEFGGNPSSNVIVSSGKRVNVAESVVETKREAGLAADAAQHHDKKSQAEAVRAAQPSDNCVTIC